MIIRIMITLIILLVVMLILLIAWPYIERHSSREPEVQRKWSDPKHHDSVD